MISLSETSSLRHTHTHSHHLMSSTLSAPTHSCLTHTYFSTRDLHTHIHTHAHCIHSLSFTHFNGHLRKDVQTTYFCAHTHKHRYTHTHTHTETVTVTQTHPPTHTHTHTRTQTHTHTHTAGSMNLRSELFT